MRVDRLILSFADSAGQAEQIVRQSREAVTRFAEGKQAHVGINTVGILQGVNRDMDRYAALLDQALEVARDVARILDIPLSEPS